MVFSYISSGSDLGNSTDQNIIQIR